MNNCICESKTYFRLWFYLASCNCFLHFLMAHDNIFVNLHPHHEALAYTRHEKNWNFPVICHVAASKHKWFHNLFRKAIIDQNLEGKGQQTALFFFLEAAHALRRWQFSIDWIDFWIKHSTKFIVVRKIAWISVFVCLVFCDIEIIIWHSHSLMAGWIWTHDEERSDRMPKQTKTAYIFIFKRKWHNIFCLPSYILLFYLFWCGLWWLIVIWVSFRFLANWQPPVVARLCSYLSSRSAHWSWP